MPIQASYVEQTLGDKGGQDPVERFLDAGQHTIIFFEREKHTRLDTLQLLLIQPAQTPTPTNTPLPTFTPTATGGPPQANLNNLGIVGNSNSDQYQANDNRGGAYASGTYNWTEQFVLPCCVNLGDWRSWGDPRRTGYAYNWARSGATAANVIPNPSSPARLRQLLRLTGLASSAKAGWPPEPPGRGG